MKTVVWFGFVLGALCAAAGQVTVTKQGQKAILTCGTGAFKSSLRWLHGDDMIVDYRERRLPRKGTSPTALRSRVKQRELTIDKVHEEDAGKFTCIADGKTYQHTLLVVSVWASSSGDLQLGSNVSLQCQVKGWNQDLKVRWTKPDGTSHIESHTVQLESVAKSDSGTWNCKFSYDDVTHIEDLQIKVKEPNHATPAPDPSHNSKTSPNRPANRPSDPGLPLGLSWWMWVVIGVGCLVVVLLTILVICLCKRVRRRRRKLQKMKNSRQLLMTKQYCQCDHPTAAEKPQQRRRREKPSALPLYPVLLE